MSLKEQATIRDSKTAHQNQKEVPLITAEGEAVKKDALWGFSQIQRNFNFFPSSHFYRKCNVKIKGKIFLIIFKAVEEMFGTDVRRGSRPSDEWNKKVLKGYMKQGLMGNMIKRTQKKFNFFCRVQFDRKQQPRPRVPFKRVNLPDHL